MAERTIGWGILSSANIGLKALIPAITGSESSRVVCLGTPNEDRAAQTAMRYGFRVYPSYEAVLDDPKVDAVYNPLPNSLHKEWTIRALEAGKHVLCEKPFALNAAEGEAMIAAARANDRVLMEAFMYRFHPQQAKLRELLDSGRIGDLRLVRTSFTFNLAYDASNIRYRRELGGGALMDVGCYCLNATRAFAGEPQAIRAYQKLHPEAQVDLTTAAVLECGEVTGVFNASFEMAGHLQMELVGTKGRIEVPRPWLPGKDDAIIHVFAGADSEMITVPGVDEYELQVNEFAECVRTGRQPLLPPEDAVRNMRAIEAVVQSSAEGRRVEL